MTDLLSGHSVKWLQGLSADGIARLLDRRPDVLRGARPRSLGELAERLDEPQGLLEVFQTATTATIQVAEALQALGGRCTRARLTGFLGSGRDHQAQVDAVIDWLADRAVVRVGDGGGTAGAGGKAGPGGTEVAARPALAVIIPDPLGLGPPLSQLLSDLGAGNLHAALAALGQPRQTRKAEALADLTAILTDPDAVRAVVAKAPDGVAETLTREAAQPQPDRDEMAGYSTNRTPREAAAMRTAMKWAGDRCLLIRAGWGEGLVMPAEVTTALRGPTYRAPFAGRAPKPLLRKVSGADVEQEAAAAAGSFAETGLAVLDLIARSGAALLKAGGLGGRELTRLAKVVGADERVVRLVLELAAETGLLARDDRLRVSPRFAGWRSQEPAERYVALVAAWWGLGSTPSEAKDEDGKTRPALADSDHCVGCLAARQGLLASLAEVPPGRASDRQSLAPAALWARPLVHLVFQDGPEHFATVWREAELLGLICLGALGGMGRALVAGDQKALRRNAVGALPASSDQAVFGTDLTVLVAGAPSARVSALLDSTADRESRGGAVVWRVTPGSVRRALDDGATGPGLLGQLQGIATAATLPQPLRYLIEDVAGRHGAVRVGPAASWLRSEDTALLAQMAVDRSLRRLHLRLLAPTVLTSEADDEETITALRAAGYLPMPDGVEPMADPAAGLAADGAAARPGAAGTSAAEPSDDESTGAGSAAVGVSAVEPAPPDDPVDLTALAEELLRVGADAPAARPGSTEQQLASLAPRLPASQIYLLAQAVDEPGRVTIVYRSTSRGVTTRTILDPELIGGNLLAWCELRRAERYFSVSRIQAVGPAR